jgi:hypothetical protein
VLAAADEAESNPVITSDDGEGKRSGLISGTRRLEHPESSTKRSFSDIAYQTARPPHLSKKYEAKTCLLYTYTEMADTFTCVSLLL